ncbi:cellulase family glycosylhydrolase, partial [Micromonospora sp. KC723]|uniref:cellulase family glycosylhydrolase n=1 Tax=Micromonospora sp. KC723 TaxID=2530381 RepID=UPI001045D1AB
MKRKIAVMGATALMMLASMMFFVKPAEAAVGLRVDAGRIVEANGSNFVMRGASHAHIWYPSQTSSFANIKALGANTVRVVLGSGQRWGPSNDIPDIVNLCRTNRLICVLEVHDTTGYGDESEAATLDQAASYWISKRSELAGTENFIVVNIGNEPMGNNASVSATWPTATSNAIRRLRTAGFEHMLMVDAPMWGQDWQFIMRNNAQAVFNSDPQRNTVFSIHMYGVFDTAAEVTDYLGRFRSAGLPIVVGEFGHDHSDGNPDEETIMSYTQANGIGYIGWSWSGNSGGVDYLDMVTNFNPNQLTSWGQRFFNGANGIRQTSREATWYSGATPPPSTPGPSTPPPSSPPPSTPPPGPAGCSATYTVTGQWQGGFQGEVRVTAGASAIRGWRVTWTFANGQRITQAWNATITTSGSNVTATNVSYNGNLGPRASTTFGFIGSGSGSNP